MEDSESAVSGDMLFHFVPLDGVMRSATIPGHIYAYFFIAFQSFLPLLIKDRVLTLGKWHKRYHQIYSTSQKWDI